MRKGGYILYVYSVQLDFEFSAKPNQELAEKHRLEKEEGERQLREELYHKLDMVTADLKAEKDELAEVCRRQDVKVKELEKVSTTPRF